MAIQSTMQVLAAVAIAVNFFTSSLASSVPVPTASIKGRLRLPDDKPLNTTLITLNDGQYSTYTQAHGDFVFHAVGPGVHVLEAHSPLHHFSQVKIQLLSESMEAPKCIEYVYPGAPKQAIPHPLLLTAHARYEYFEKRQGFSLFSILRNPMMLMMMFSVGLMLLMPKMMEGLDDDQKEQMKRQMEMQQDPSKMLTQLWGDISGTGESDNTTLEQGKRAQKLVERQHGEQNGTNLPDRDMNTVMDVPLSTGVFWVFLVGVCYPKAFPFVSSTALVLLDNPVNHTSHIP
eukprot:CAMPEP_0183295848 /NCGR_PEP_ID=MMETSP0160_2-20130417/3652_1 /TAXON_ID=2839 ORGANISM="Odontella Sinensis, Strain Grunow 1884" /NCGR_SAMPLE_ID=MMETSP0160_2 /ASSEMBLY_ACC=CAM_ASM_000250 /LENGTH=287 /DNA_ID=CAMNT_0025457387 /DNA_START=53 /DNA_END=917 /DNA_ORIENTATION=+